jgi:UDP:flavonoid glycosyltransferase YjiC (YdhE family)
MAYYPEKMRSAALVIHATDPAFDPPPDSLPAHHIYSGPLFWESGAAAVPTYFEQDGDPWILVNITTADLVRFGDQLLQAAIEAFAHRPLRALITLGSRRESEGATLPPNVHVEKYVSHSKIMQKLQLVISAAGHGITTKSIVHGVPTILIPYGFDQPGVARRAAALGCAQILQPHQVSAENLWVAIDRVLATPVWRDAAANAAMRMARTDARAIACDAIERLVN